MSQLHLEALSGKNLEDLVVLINTDKALVERLRSGRASQSVVELEKQIRQFSHINHAQAYAIMDVKKSIGMAVIAYRDFVLNSARLTFWLATAHSDKDTMNQAFSLALDAAHAMKLSIITGKMHRDDKWLTELWWRNGAQKRELADGTVYMDISL
ncbi:MAG: hypothetical protein ACOX88_02235 [Christensenellales bacterium]|jgi:hypothetical protein